LPDELKAIDAQQIQAVAAKTFDRKKMTVGVLRSPEEQP
jgi:predicted Zn-dependent peptidase